MTAKAHYPEESYYDLLGVSPTAGRGEIRAAYLRSVEEARAGGSGSSRRLKLLHGAYEVLVDERRRVAYNTYLLQPAASESTAAPDDPPVQAQRAEQPDGLVSGVYVGDFATPRVSGPPRPKRPDAVTLDDDGYPTKQDRGFEFAMSRTAPSASDSFTLDFVDSFRRRKYRVGRRRHRPVRNAILLLALVLVVVLLIIYAVNRHKADEAERAANYAAGLAVIEQSVRASQVGCYVALTGSGSTEQAVTHKHYPCTGVPLSGSGVGDSYSTVITVTGLSSVAADQYGIWLFCSQENTIIAASSYNFSSGPGIDLRVFLSGTAGQVVDGPPQPIDCAIRDSNGANIQTTHIVMKLDPRHRFAA